MITGFSFEILARSGKARRGRLVTPHGVVDTPAFMPVGTQATVKSLTPAQLVDAGAQIVLANTYHLLLRPGPDVVRQLGGLHAMMAWPGAILTDSGGFQVYSLTDLRTLDDDGVTFRSHVDGALQRLTPESAMQVQHALGADIIMCLDECPPLPATPEQLAAAIRRTSAWARRCRHEHLALMEQRAADVPAQALYGIVQGGLDVGMRRACLEALIDVGFDGYALGGLSVGEPPPEMHAFLDAFADALPAERPRYVMGIGTPLDLVEAVASGVDQFDCVMPTRNGRKGYAFTSTGTVRLRNAVHKCSRAPLDETCGCYTCRSFSRGYLRHLFITGELLGGALVSLHNLSFYHRLTEQMREAIAAGAFAAWRAEFLRSPAASRVKDTEQA